MTIVVPEAYAALSDLEETLDNWLEVTGDRARLDRLEGNAIAANKRLLEQESDPGQRAHWEKRLAGALDARAGRLYTTGQSREGLQLAEEALEIARRLAAGGTEGTAESGRTLVSTLTTVGVISGYLSNPSRAIDLLKEAWNIAQDMPEWAGAADVAYQLGCAYEDASDPAAKDKAKEWYERAIALSANAYPEEDARRYEAYARTRLGNLYLGEDVARARSHLERSHDLKKQYAGPYSVAISLRALAQVAIAEEDFPRAKELCDEAVRLDDLAGSAGLENRRIQAYAYVEVARACTERGRLEEALAAYEAALARCDGDEDLKLYATVHGEMGKAWQAKANYAEAEAAYQEALVWNEKAGDGSGVAVSQHTLGRLYEEWKHFDQALAAYQASLPFWEIGGDQEACAIVHYRLGDTYRSLAELEEARDSYEHSLALWKSLGDDETLAITYRALGSVLHELERYDDALAAFEASLRLRDPDADPQLHGVVLHDIADVYRAQGQLDRARGFYEQARDAKARGTNPSDFAVTLHQLADVHEQLGHPGDALATYEHELRVLQVLEPPDASRTGLARLQIARLLLQQHRPINAVKYAESARGDLITAEMDDLEIEAALAVLEDAYRVCGQDDDARMVHDQARELVLRAAAEARTESDAMRLLGLGAHHLRHGELDHAAEVFDAMEQLHDLFQDDEDENAPAFTKARLAIAQHQLGRRYEDESSYAQALHSYEAALRLTEPEQDPRFYPLHPRDVGDVHRAQRNVEESRAAYDEVIAYADTANDVHQMSMTYRSLGLLYKDARLFDEGLAAFHTSLHLRDQDEDPVAYGTVFHDIGDLYRAQGEVDATQTRSKLDAARTAYEQARNFKARGNDPDTLAATLDRLAGVYAKLGLIDDAVATYQQELAAIESLDQPAPVAAAAAHVATARLLLGHDRPGGALQHALDARAIFATHGIDRPIDLALILRVVEQSYRAVDRTEEAERAAGEARSLVGNAAAAAREQSDVDALLRVAEYFWENKELDDTAEVCDEMEQLLNADTDRTDQAVTKKARLKQQVAIARYVLGREFEEREDYDRALTTYRGVLRLSDAQTDPGFHGRVLHDIGDVYRAQNDREAARDAYLEAIAYKSKADNPRDVAATYRTLGVLYEKWKKYDEALAAYQESLKLRDPDQDPHMYGVVLHDIGDVYHAQGELDRACEAYERARDYKAQGDDKSDLAVTIHRLAEVYAELDRTDDALAAYEHELSILEMLPDREPVRISVAQLQMAQVLLKCDRPSDALQRALEARAMLPDTGGEAGALAVAGVLAVVEEAYRALGQDDEAAQARSEADLLMAGLAETAVASGDPETLLLLGAYYMEHDQLATAADLFERMEKMLT